MSTHDPNPCPAEWFQQNLFTGSQQDFICISTGKRTSSEIVQFGQGWKAAPSERTKKKRKKILILLQPFNVNLISFYYGLCCTAKTPPIFHFLWQMSVKYQRSAMEWTVSPSIPLFCPCRALTSLMKTRLPSCLFFPWLLTRRRKLSSASQQQKILQTRPRQ